MIKKIVVFFDRLEDKTRGFLSKRPIIYAGIASIGMVLLWRGIWHLADEIELGAILSTIIGIFILLMTGIFVSGFIGNRILITGIKNEKKLEEKTKIEIETDIEKENKILTDIKDSIAHIEKEIEVIEHRK